MRKKGGRLTRLCGRNLAFAIMREKGRRILTKLRPKWEGSRMSSRKIEEEFGSQMGGGMCKLFSLRGKGYLPH